jgi:hypothetical protein
VGSTRAFSQGRTAGGQGTAVQPWAELCNPFGIGGRVQSLESGRGTQKVGGATVRPWAGLCRPCGTGSTDIACGSAMKAECGVQNVVCYSCNRFCEAIKGDMNAKSKAQNLESDRATQRVGGATVQPLTCIVEPVQDSGRHCLTELLRAHIPALMNRRGKRTFLLMAQCASVLAVLIGYPAPAQKAPQTLARELLREMIETDTTGQHGDTTTRQRPHGSSSNLRVVPFWATSPVWRRSAAAGLSLCGEIGPKSKSVIRYPGPDHGAGISAR